jgi:FkbM family methyltransferase
MIEADNEESSRLKKEFPEYTVHEKGVWETETTKFLNISRHTGWSSILEPNHKVLHEINNNNDHTVVKQIPVDVTTLNNLFGIKNFFDFIKIDVQGGDFQMLLGGNDLLNNTLLIETEVSFRPFYKDMKTFCEIKGLLETYGFILLDISDQLYNRKDGYSDGYASEYGELVHTDAIFINMRAIMRANVNRLFACICLLLNYNKISLAFFIIKENKSRINSKAYDSFIRILKNHANRNKSSGVIGIRI